MSSIVAETMFNGSEPVVKLRPIILAYLLVVLTSPAEATTYCVATNGSNTNPGTVTLPWLTINYAVGASSSVGAGDTIMVRGGNYPEVVNPGKAGTPGSPIVLMNYPGENVTLDPGRFNLGDGDDYWKISGLKFKHSSDNGFRVTGTHGMLGYLTISNCEFTAHDRNGIVLSGPDFGGITIEDCLIDSNGVVSEGSAILMYDGVGVIWAHRNHILNNDGKGITHASELPWESDSSVIDSNIIINSAASGIDWWGDNSYITNNYISCNGQRTLEVNVWGDKGLAIDQQSSGNLIAFNVIKSSGRWELVPRGTNNYYYNNTLIKDHYYDLIYPPSPAAATMMFFLSAGLGNEFKNNIFVNLVSEEYHHYAIIAETAANYYNNIWAYNCYMCTYSDTTIETDKPFKLYGFPGGDPYGTLYDVQTAYPTQEIGSIWADPVFTSYVDSVFTLQLGSPCIDAGVDVGLPYLGDAPDMGAFEYDPESLEPYIVLNPSQLNFGMVVVDTQKDLTFDICNTGDDTLVIYSVISSSGNFTTDYAEADSLIAPDSSLTITVSFIPTEATGYSETITITNNSSNDATKDLSLTGTGYIPGSTNSTQIIRIEIRMNDGKNQERR